MHILVVSQYFWPENFRINDLTEDWLRRGHRVTILTGRPNYPSGILFEEFKQNPKEFSSYHDAPVMRVPMLVRSSGAIRLFLNYISFVIGACLFGPLSFVVCGRMLFLYLSHRLLLWDCLLSCWGD